jgi:hypothetical protein
LEFDSPALTPVSRIEKTILSWPHHSFSDKENNNTFARAPGVALQWVEDNPLPGLLVAPFVYAKHQFGIVLRLL